MTSSANLSLKGNSWVISLSLSMKHSVLCLKGMASTHFHCIMSYLHVGDALFSFLLRLPTEWKRLNSHVSLAHKLNYRHTFSWRFKVGVSCVVTSVVGALTDASFEMIRGKF